MNNELRHFVRRSNEVITADDLVLQVEEAIDYYASMGNREKNTPFRSNDTEAAYQRDYKTAERHLLPSGTQFYSQPASQQQFSRQERAQPPPNRGYSNQQSGNPAPPRQYS